MADMFKKQLKVLFFWNFFGKFFLECFKDFFLSKREAKQASKPPVLSIELKILLTLGLLRLCHFQSNSYRSFSSPIRENAVFSIFYSE
jgi:hypothetical protein